MLCAPRCLFVTLWTVGPQAPLSMGFSRQEHWCGLAFPPPGGLLNPGVEPEPLCLLRWKVGSIWEALSMFKFKDLYSYKVLQLDLWF